MAVRRRGTKTLRASKWPTQLPAERGAKAGRRGAAAGGHTRPKGASFSALKSRFGAMRLGGLFYFAAASLPKLIFRLMVVIKLKFRASLQQLLFK